MNPSFKQKTEPEQTKTPNLTQKTQPTNQQNNKNISALFRVSGSSDSYL